VNVGFCIKEPSSPFYVEGELSKSELRVLGALCKNPLIERINRGTCGRGLFNAIQRRDRAGNLGGHGKRLGMNRDKWIVYIGAHEKGFFGMLLDTDDVIRGISALSHCLESG
jgi:hypothetical protein